MGTQNIFLNNSAMLQQAYPNLLGTKGYVVVVVVVLLCCNKLPSPDSSLVSL
jgi:hypothetical protein